VAILGINYAPEPTGIAPYTTGLARGLAARGHHVEVLTGFPHYPEWKRLDNGTGLRNAEFDDRVLVRRFAHHVPQQPSGLGRAIMELTFGVQLLATRWNRPDVVLCVTPPLLTALIAMVRARLTWRGPAIGAVLHDVYSTGVVETGAMSTDSARLVRALESMTLRMADGVAVIHDGFTDILVEQLNVDRDRICAIRNWNHIAPPDPVASASFRRAHGWAPDEVVVLHAGNMGVKQGLENIVAAAELSARENRRARFILLGDGNQRARLESAAAGVPNLEFMPPVSEDAFPAALGAADVLLVNERPGVAQMSVPSKLTSYFTSGKPVLAATDADGLTARELEAAGAGLRVPADRPDLLLAAAMRLGGDRAFAAELGDAGRRYSAAVLSGDNALDRYEEWVLSLACRRSRTRMPPTTGLGDAPGLAVASNQEPEKAS
jgi:colanic acid biosynthesis glycosyl transferase WcaI